MKLLKLSQRWGINMKRLILVLSIIFVLGSFSFVYSADWVAVGTPAPYDGVIFPEPVAKQLLENTQMCVVDREERDALAERVKIQQEINDTLKKELTAYKTSYEQTKTLLDNQIELTKKSTEQCKEMLKHSKPSLLEDIGKVGIGVVIGALAILLL
jgi:hypothetical protein